MSVRVGLVECVRPSVHQALYAENDRVLMEVER